MTWGLNFDKKSAPPDSAPSNCEEQPVRLAPNFSFDVNSPQWRVCCIHVRTLTQVWALLKVVFLLCAVLAVVSQLVTNCKHRRNEVGTARVESYVVEYKWNTSLNDSGTVSITLASKLVDYDPYNVYRSSGTNNTALVICLLWLVALLLSSMLLLYGVHKRCARLLLPYLFIHAMMLSLTCVIMLLGSLLLFSVAPTRQVFSFVLPSAIQCAIGLFIQMVVFKCYKFLLAQNKAWQMCARMSHNGLTAVYVMTPATKMENVSTTETELPSYNQVVTQNA